MGRRDVLRLGGKWHHTASHGGKHPRGRLRPLLSLAKCTVSSPRNLPWRKGMVLPTFCRGLLHMCLTLLTHPGLYRIGSMKKATQRWEHHKALLLSSRGWTTQRSLLFGVHWTSEERHRMGRAVDSSGGPMFLQGVFICKNRATSGCDLFVPGEAFPATAQNCSWACGGGVCFCLFVFKPTIAVRL